MDIYILKKNEVYNPKGTNIFQKSELGLEDAIIKYGGTRTIMATYIVDREMRLYTFLSKDDRNCMISDSVETVIEAIIAKLKQ